MRKALAPLFGVTRRAGLYAAIRSKALVGCRIFPTQAAEPTDFCSTPLSPRCTETSIVPIRPRPLTCLAHSPAYVNDKVDFLHFVSKSPVTMPAPGDFSFMTDKSEREMLADMYRAVTTAEAWDDMKADPGEGGFMFSRSAQAARVLGALADPGVHSGASFGFCMRVMQMIARDGWDSYVQARITAASPVSLT